jgi:hypothetical protein
MVTEVDGMAEAEAEVVRLQTGTTQWSTGCSKDDKPTGDNYNATNEYSTSDHDGKHHSDAVFLESGS